MLQKVLLFLTSPPSRFLSIYLSPVRLFLFPHFVSPTPYHGLSYAHFSLLELKICQTTSCIR